MLQTEKPDTFVLSTGRTERVRDFVNMSFKCVDIDIEWKGKEENETGIDSKSGKVLIKVNPNFYRPAEVELLVGDCAKANKILDWEAKTTLETLAKLMVEKDITRNKNGWSF